MSQVQGLDALVNALDPVKFQQVFRQMALEEVARAARMAERVAKRMIAEGTNYAPNAPLTLLLKAPSTTPLINHGDLLGSIKGISEVGQSDMAFSAVSTVDLVLGANKTVPEMVKGADGKMVATGKRINVAWDLHYGDKKKRIPPRPYLARPLQRQDVRDEFKQAAARALKRTYEALGAKGSKT